MKRQNMTIVGRVNTKGQFFIHNKNEMDTFFKTWPDMRVTIEVTVYPKGSNASQLGYYFKKIVPDMQQGFISLGERITFDETVHRLQRMSPVCRKKEGIVPVQSLSMNEMSEHIDFCRQIGAQEMGLNIENPKLL